MNTKEKKCKLSTPPYTVATARPAATSMTPHRQSCSPSTSYYSAPMTSWSAKTNLRSANGCVNTEVYAMDQNVFKTRRLPLAIWIDAANGEHNLTFSHCQPIGGSMVEFCFSDPGNEGPLVEREFDRGNAVAEVSRLFASQRFLRKQTLAALNGTAAVGSR
jgi:hypothetical protein